MTPVDFLIWVAVAIVVGFVLGKIVEKILFK